MSRRETLGGGPALEGACGPKVLLPYSLGVMSGSTPEHPPVEPPASAGPGDGRYVKEPEGEDPRDTDQLLYDEAGADVAARLASERHVTHDQPVEGDMGVSSDDAGHNPADRDQLPG